MISTGLPSFWKWRALVLHRRDHNYRALSGQLARIGLHVSCLFPPVESSAIDGDVILFDADLSHKHLFPWSPGESPVPLIAILGSEAPGPLERTLLHAPSAFLQKPIGSTGVFNALVVAHHSFAEVRTMRRKLTELAERVRARPVVLRAILILMREKGLSDVAAMELLRRHAMSESISMEALAAKLVTMSSGVPMQLPTRKGNVEPNEGHSIRKRGGC